jgi:EmrB/QacA subfamily drug resistance transporter
MFSRLRSIPYQWLVAIVFVTGLFMELLDTTVVYVALPTLGREFDASNTHLEWVATAYLLSLAVWIPASGWLGDRFGTKRIFLIALVLFTLGSVLCGLAWNLNALIAFRVLQGVGGGMLTPVGTAMLFRAFLPAERVRAASVSMVPATLAPTLGPIVGGYLVDGSSWRWIFYLNVPIGCVGFVFAWLVLREQRGDVPGRFDLPGFVLAAIGVPSVLFALTQAPDTGWGSPRVWASGMFGIVTLALLIKTELRREHPMLNMRLLLHRRFRRSTVVLFAGTASFIGMLFTLPLFLQQARGLSAMESGLTTFPQALGVVTIAPIASRLISKIPARRLLGGGMSVFILATLPFLAVDLETNLWWVRALMLARGLGAGLVSLTAQAEAFSTLPSQDMGRASALYATSRQIAGAVGVAILATILAQHNLTTSRADAAVREFHQATVAAVLIAAAGFVTIFLVRVDVRTPSKRPAPKRLRSVSLRRAQEVSRST